MSEWVPPGHGQEVADAAGYTMKLAEVAVRLGVTPTKLGTWRARGIGPSWCRDGGFATSPILYKPAEIEAVQKDMRAHRSAEKKADVSGRINRRSKARRPRRRKAAA